jgi:UDP-N-acetylmuramoyl-L-alanyl-D-glutamate--2,6-diaminopimelate ligase
MIDLAVDARRVRPGSVFYCIRGSGVDGHDWVDVAVANGAAAIVAERPLDAPVPVTVVEDARAALAHAADEAFDRPSERLPVVGITGTSGKTTTAYLLHSILAAAGRSPGLWGTIETQIGAETVPTPRWSPVAVELQRAFAAMIEQGNRSCVIEATSYESDLRRLDGVHFAALVFTNLGHDHLDHHGTMEAYFEAKRRFFHTGGWPAALNADDPYGRRLVAELASSRRVLTFGDGGELRAEQVEHTVDGTRLRVGRLGLRTPLVGAFNVENVLAAVAAARLLDVDDAAIAAGVEALAGVPGRMERIDEGQPFFVFVDYAHKPEALDAVLRAARVLTRARVLCVFGCGGETYRGKRAAMGRMARSLADVVVVTTDNPRDEDPVAIAADIAAGGKPDVVELDRRRAIGLALELAGPGDAVVVAGRGHEQEQLLAGGRTEAFDDRSVVREFLRD